MLQQTQRSSFVMFVRRENFSLIDATTPRFAGAHDRVSEPASINRIGRRTQIADIARHSRMSGSSPDLITRL